MLAIIDGLRVARSGPGAVRVSWKPTILHDDALANYVYLISYFNTMGSELPKDIEVPITSTSKILSNLNNDAVYEFSMAIRKQVGTEQIVGEWTEPKTYKLCNGYPDHTKGAKILRSP